MSKEKKRNSIKGRFPGEQRTHRPKKMSAKILLCWILLCLPSTHHQQQPLPHTKTQTCHLCAQQKLRFSEENTLVDVIKSILHSVLTLKLQQVSISFASPVYPIRLTSSELSAHSVLTWFQCSDWQRICSDHQLNPSSYFILLTDLL